MFSTPPLPKLIGRSPAFGAVRAFVERAGPVDAPVLIQGESGTGKTLLARHMHLRSRRAGSPMVAINCAAVAESLFESELFGHARGAFTGAHADRRGLIAAADGGTLFLDEVGDLPAAQQAKLLAAVEERRIRPIGTSEWISIDFRLISATCRTLAEERRAGRFREDLFHRIALLTVTLPPLRDRRDDIMPLARRFLDAAVVRHGLDERVFDLPVREVLSAHPWPGNVRQLAHVVEASAVLSEGTRIEVDVVRGLLERST